MEDDRIPAPEKPARRPPWNKGKLVGAKPPFRPSHVWSIRTKLQMQSLSGDLALFNLALDSKLRGCDVVAVRVDDIALSDYALDRATVRQTKTGTAVGHMNGGGDSSGGARRTNPARASAALVAAASRRARCAKARPVVVRRCRFAVR